MIPRLDRYILREMIPPYCMAMAVIIIFISMNLLALLAEYMINRDVSWTDLLRILFYRMPELVVVGLPIAVLFGVFLALGRLMHDRELIALQSSGISLRRAIVPVVVFGLIVSALTFAINEHVTPWSMQQYWSLLGRLASRGSLPQIQDNTIFKDAGGRFFYVKRYYRQTQRMEDVLVYDPNGQTYMPELAGPFPQMISATEAEWDGANWTLRQGIAHAFNAEGALSYQASFDTLTIKVGDAIESFFVQQRQPREMNLGELAQQIETFQKAGQPVSNLVVEYHYKLVLPLSALVYALLTAPLSLSFGLRGRAMGTVVGLLLAFLFQGALYTVIVLSRRELLPPDWGPWLPNIAFGLAGIVLILNVDRLSRLELGRWFAKAAVVALLIPLWGAQVRAQEPPPLPLEVEAQALEISSDGQSFVAQGDVRARYGQQSIFAQELRLEQLDAQRWRLAATGEVSLQDPDFHVRAQSIDALLERSAGALAPRQIALFAFTVDTQAEMGRLRFKAQAGMLEFDEQLKRAQLEGQVSVQAEAFELTARALTFQRAEQDRWRLQARGDVELSGSKQRASGESLDLDLQIAQDEARVQAIELENFNGEGTFTNALGQEHPIRYQGRRAQFLFEDQELKQLTLDQAQFTTCACEDTVAKSSYSLGGKQVILWADEWVLGREITLSTYGVPVFWLPLFFAPLKDIERSDLLPRLGQDAQRGWFAQWRLPVFVDADNRGALLVDYYNRYRETGLGLDWNYRLPAQTQSGRLQLYHLVGAHEVLDWSWSHLWPISRLAQLQWSLTRRDVQPAAAAPSQWSYDVQLDGKRADWSWQLAGARQETSQPDPGSTQTPPAYQVLERLPELTVSHRSAPAGLPLQYAASASWGRFREQRQASGPFLERDRLDAGANVSLTPLEVQSASLRLAATAGARYTLYGADQRRGSGQFQADLQWTPLKGTSASLSYAYRAVQGQSPFAFDALSVTDRLSGQLRFQPFGAQLTLSGAYAFGTQRFDPITLEFNTSIHQYALNGMLRTQPNALSLDAIQIAGSWTPDWGQVTASGGYLVSAGRFSDLIIKGSAGQLRLGVRVDPNALRLLRSNAEFTVSWEPWSLDFRGEYDWSQGRFSALQVGLVHHFCHDCWQAGVYLSGQRIWLQVQINAFPGASIQYSPTDGALSFK